MVSFDETHSEGTGVLWRHGKKIKTPLLLRHSAIECSVYSDLKDVKEKNRARRAPVVGICLLCLQSRAYIYIYIWIMRIQTYMRMSFLMRLLMSFLIYIDIEFYIYI